MSFEQPNLEQHEISTKQVWIIEDEPGVAQIISESISLIVNDPNLDIRIFSHGGPALAELDEIDSERLPKVIIIDQNIASGPEDGAKGDRIVSRVRTQPRFDDIILMTNSSDSDSNQLMQKLGANEIFQKPSSPMQIALRIKELFSSIGDGQHQEPAN